MKNFTEHDLLMVYLDECEDKHLQQQILASASACQRLAQLEKDMKSIEASSRNSFITSKVTDADYGHQLWSKIANQLDQAKQPSWFNKLKHMLLIPQFSLAGLAAVFVVAITFYMLGTHQAKIDSEDNNLSNQLLTQNIQYHLSQADIFLTQVSNMPQIKQSTMMVNTAKHLLSSNRIFKSALQSPEYSQKNNQQLNLLLTELEQVLTEISNSSPKLKQNYLYQYTQEQLLFKVKSINQQLKNDSTLIYGAPL